MKYAIIWTWTEPTDDDPEAIRQRVGYFTTLAEAMASFDEPSFGEKELVAILETRGDCTK